MASDILQNKTYSRSYYIVVNIWHLLIVPKLLFFPPTWHTPHSSNPHWVSFSPPTGAQTWRDQRIQAQPWNLLWIWAAAGRKAIFERILLLNLLQQGRMCAFLCRVFALTKMLTQIPFWFSYQQLLGAASQHFLMEQFSTRTGMLSKLYMKCRNLE